MINAYRTTKDKTVICRTRTSLGTKNAFRVTKIKSISISLGRYYSITWRPLIYFISLVWHAWCYFHGVSTNFILTMQFSSDFTQSRWDYILQNMHFQFWNVFCNRIINIKEMQRLIEQFRFLFYVSIAIHLSKFSKFTFFW